MQQAARVIQSLVGDTEMHRTMQAIADHCVAALRAGNKLIFAGNGGSAADAQHFAAEMVGKFYFDRAGMPALALNTDTSMLTAIGNDFGFEKVFARQLEANGRKGDVFFALSTSGASANILEAIRACGGLGITTVGLTSVRGGQMAAMCDFGILVPDRSTPRIQEAHTVIGHAICAYIEDRYFQK
ncbi:MAG: SIS domain-containing protein [Gammaproteobacteria bacterium]|nr:SIS domain-containing protein [Gammaproteobacteria bacterium]